MKYTDESDASGNENSVSDSATFDLRNAVLQSDKSVYVIGQDALLTLIEADLNLDSGAIDNIGLDRINWDSEAYDGSINAVRADLGPGTDKPQGDGREHWNLPGCHHNLR